MQAREIDDVMQRFLEQLMREITDRDKKIEELERRLGEANEYMTERLQANQEEIARLRRGEY